MNQQDSWRTLSDNAHRTITFLNKKAIVHAEAFFTSGQSTEVTIRNSEILTKNRVDDLGVGFRVVSKGNKVGFACTNAIGKEEVLAAGETAFNIAKISSATPDFALPSAGKLPVVNGLFDPRVAEINVEEVVDIAERASRATEDFDKRVVAKDGGAFFQVEHVGIMNTLGVDVEEERTHAIAYIGASGEQNSEVTSSCYEVMYRRALELNPELVGQNAARKVVRLFEPKSLESFEGTVVFSPEAVSYQLVTVMLNALKGDNVVARRSLWGERIGEQVASSKLTVEDDALFEGGFSARSFDDEGCPSKKTTLLKNGELKGFLHYATSANALAVEDTGNASRFPGGFDMIQLIIGKGYRAKPEVYSSNLTIQPGSKTTEELLAEVDKGVLIESMAGFPQAGSGIISAQLSR
ncbi:MAG: TldD/PmbA family protein, partial [Candidatus Bathyarchaeota archaeon]